MRTHTRSQFFHLILWTWESRAQNNAASHTTLINVCLFIDILARSFIQFIYITLLFYVIYITLLFYVIYNLTSRYIYIQCLFFFIVKLSVLSINLYDNQNGFTDNNLTSVMSVSFILPAFIFYVLPEKQQSTFIYNLTSQKIKRRA
jgi:hypothetical protein